MQKVIFNQP